MSKLIYTCVWQIHFHLNQKEIIALECENKNRPEMHCNGKCFLAKKLKLADEQLQTKKEHQSNSLQKLKAFEDTDISFSLKPFFEFSSDTTEIHRSFINYTDLYHFQPFHTIFHPPCC